MKIRHIALGLVLSLCTAGSSWAITTNTNNNNNFNSQNFRSSPFSFSNNNMSLSQSLNTDTGEMCQFFIINIGFAYIVQVVTNTSMTQYFSSSPVQDPCI